MKLFKIFKTIIYIIFLFIITFILLLNIFSVFNVSLFKFRVYKIASGSMRPYLNINDIVIVMEQNDYQVNDVVTYHADNMYITHRIVKINDDEVITKGDANNIVDNKFTKDKIVGKVIYRFKIFSFLSKVLSKPLILLFMFIIGLFITILLPEKNKLNI